MRFPAFFSLVVIAACAGSPPPPPPPPPAASPLPPGCAIASRGALIGYSYRDAPPPRPRAGPIADGTYDLVEIVKYTSEVGPWSSNMAPAFRWALGFTTVERSPNHAEGRMSSNLNMPPAVSCDTASFATFQRELRVAGGPKGIDSLGYTAQGDALHLIRAHGDGGGAEEYVFRRRN